MHSFEALQKLKCFLKMTKTSPLTSNYAVRIAKNATTRKKYTAGVRFDRRSLIFTLELQFLQCLGRQAVQKLHVSANIVQ